MDYIGTTLRKSAKQLNVDRIIASILNGSRVLILMRGLPGSGKSHLAKSILKNSILGTELLLTRHIFSSDDFFMSNGVYSFNPTRLPEAHEYNQRLARDALKTDINPVIIDNTNTQLWEMKPYAVMAQSHNYSVEVVEPDTWWCFDEYELARRNLHFVPRYKIRTMLDRYEKNVTVEILLNSIRLSSLVNTTDNIDTVQNVSKCSDNNTYQKGPSNGNYNSQQQIKETNTVKLMANSVEQIDKSTCIEYNLFHIEDNCHQLFDEKCIKCIARDINEKTNVLITCEATITAFDQSCFVIEKELNEQNERPIQHLCELFSSFPSEYLLEIFNKCDRNLEWSIDMILDDSSHKCCSDNNIMNNSTIISKNALNESLSPNDIIISDTTKTINLNIDDSDKRSYSIYTDGKLASSSELKNDIESKNVKNEYNFKSTAFCMEDLQDAIVQNSNIDGEFIALIVDDELLSIILDLLYRQQDVSFEQQIKQDEQLARNLQEKELENASKCTTITAQQLCKDITIRLNGDSMDKWKTSQETLAEKLTLQNLFTEFPHVEQKIVRGMFDIFKSKYNETRNELIKCYGFSSQCLNNTVKIEDEALVEGELHNQEINNVKLLEHYSGIYNECLTKRNSLLEASQYYHRNELHLIAAFYSMASKKHANIFDGIIHKLSATIVNDSLEKFKSINILDLHNLHVRSAIAALDEFLDRGICWLRRLQKPAIILMVITGRGKHSPYGLCRIKVAVINRLKNRSIKVSTLNPGYLQVTVYCKTLLCEELF